MSHHHLVDFDGGKGEFIGFWMSLKCNQNEKHSGQGGPTDEQNEVNKGGKTISGVILSLAIMILFFLQRGCF